MSIAFDASSNGIINPGTVLTVSHTCTGSNRGLFAAIVGHTTDSITSVTYAGAAMTQVNKAQTPGGRFCYLYYLGAPAAGANNIVITLPVSVLIECNAASYTGVSQSGQPEASNTNTGSSVTSLSTAVTTTTDNAWVVQAVAQNTSGLTAGASTTQRSANNIGALQDSNAAVTPVGSRTLIANGGGTRNMAAVIAAFAPTAADTTPPTVSASTTTSISSSGATIGATTDEATGTMYAIACTSATPPSVPQIQAGQDSASAAAAYAGNQTISSTGAKTFSATGLAPSTTYYHYEQHKDAAGNDSTVLASASFTTSVGAATGVTMSGPSSGTVGAASSNFNIGVTPGGGTITGTVTVTPADGGAGGTFTPTTVNLTTGSPTATFTYTAASSGAKTISVTNNGSLTNPSNISYTASSAASSLFRNNPGGALSGLGTGGPFFQNPLQ